MQIVGELWEKMLNIFWTDKCLDTQTEVSYLPTSMTLSLILLEQACIKSAREKKKNKSPSIN